jgi:hypothetical protein
VVPRLVGKASASAHSLRASIAANVLQETDAHYGVEAWKRRRSSGCAESAHQRQSSPFYQQIQWKVDNPSANIQSSQEQPEQPESSQPESSPYYAQSRGALQAGRACYTMLGRKRDSVEWRGSQTKKGASCASGGRGFLSRQPARLVELEGGREMIAPVACCPVLLLFLCVDCA